jgi:prolyl 4-hydroxylase
MAGTAITDLRERARAGDLRALTSLGRRLLTGDGVTQAAKEGVACLEAAAARGDGEATSQLALLSAWGILRPRSVDVALDQLQRAAELGWEPSRRELRFLAGGDGDGWPALRRRVDVTGWITPPAVRVVSEAPRIRVCEGFASKAECEWLIALARHRLRRALIYRKDASGHTQSDSRTNTESDYTFGNIDVVLSLLSERVAAAVGVESRYFEIAKLLNYEPGQQFAPHCDFQEPATPALMQEIQRHGQRVATALVYLNDDYAGGETDFPRIGLRYKGARGDALFFDNVRPSGALDYDTLHAGLPPTSGVKWVYSQWIRDRPVRSE